MNFPTDNLWWCILCWSCAVYPFLLLLKVIWLDIWINQEGKLCELNNAFCLARALSCDDVYRWGCPPSKFPWTYSSKETCYLLKGKVKVYPDGSNEAVEIGAGDLVEFPKGMSCTWDVSEEVDKHYNFEWILGIIPPCRNGILIIMCNKHFTLYEYESSSNRISESQRIMVGLCFSGKREAIFLDKCVQLD